MSDYRAPLRDMQFVIDELLSAEQVLGNLPYFAELGVGAELTSALLDEAAKLAADVLAPLRRVGDMEPARCEDRKIILPPGFAEAVVKLAEGGWTGISAPLADGGQGLPELYGTAASEMWNSANMAFALGPFLTSGAALALSAHGNDTLKARYLEKLNSGEWMGTMCLTESGAGSDLGVMKTRAVPEGDHYRLFGQKIYITWGDHEACNNIVHLVLAKLPDAPEGSRGISLFLVPKFLPDDSGAFTVRNDVYPVSTEHKLGIHGSPTCVMAFGDQDGAVGYLVGEANEGLRCMFTMMNEARLKVGLQGLGAAEGSLQKALTYARERVQGGVPIIQHPDVKRMILTMRTLVEAMRALAYTEAVTMDLAHYGPESERSAQQSRIDLMIPIIKAWLTEVGMEVCSLAIQVYGGMGYVEETGVAQFLRDVRITPIYEGTNGIQAADLVNRKLLRDGGATMASVQAAIADTLEALSQHSDTVSLQAMAARLREAAADLERATETLLEQGADAPEVALGASFDYLMQCGYVLGGWHLARSALVAQGAIAAGSDEPFYQQKIMTAQYYAEQLLPRARAHAESVWGAHGVLRDYPLEWL